MSAAPDCPLGPAGRAWVEARLGWLLDRFGDQVRTAPVVQVEDVFRDSYDASPEAAEGLFERVRGLMRLDHVGMRFGLYDERTRAPWAQGDGSVSGTAGHFVKNGPGELQDVRVEVGQLADPVALVATLAHELGHVALIGEERIAGDELDHEPLTDLLTVFVGFGLFTANSVVRERVTSTHWSVGRLGYLRQEHLAYALALLARLRGEARPAWASALDRDVRTWFHESLAWLEAAGWGPGPAEEARRHAQRLDAEQFARLWEAAWAEEPTTRARFPLGCLLLGLALGGLCLAGVVVRPIVDVLDRPVHVVNGTPWPATVQLEADPTRRVEVPPRARRTLAVGEGRHVLLVTTPRGVERVEAAVETSWSERFDHRHPVFVVDVLAAAALLEVTATYGPPGTVGGPRPRLHHGRSFHTLRLVDHPFEEPPTTIYGKRGQVLPDRLVVSWPGEGHAAADAILHTDLLDPAAARALLARHRALCPDDAALRTLVLGGR